MLLEVNGTADFNSELTLLIVGFVIRLIEKGIDKRRSKKIAKLKTEQAVEEIRKKDKNQKSGNSYLHRY
jgi:hypothetical protein